MSIRLPRSNAEPGGKTPLMVQWVCAPSACRTSSLLRSPASACARRGGCEPRSVSMNPQIHNTAMKMGGVGVPAALSGLLPGWGLYPGFCLRLHPGLYSCRRFAAQGARDFTGYRIISSTLRGLFSKEVAAMEDECILVLGALWSRDLAREPNPLYRTPPTSSCAPRGDQSAGPSEEDRRWGWRQTRSGLHRVVQRPSPTIP